MKKVFTLVSKLSFIMFLVLIIACGKEDEKITKQSKADLTVKGGIPDKIIFTGVENKETALTSVREGKADLFLSHISQNKLDDKNLDMYQTTSEIWSLLLNPAPNNAPYQLKVNNNLEFNPFAIREVRYALNFLLDRKYVVDEILKGLGNINISPVISGTANSWKFDVQAKKIGISDNGNKEAAINDINKAMGKAASLSENQGKLAKKNGFWYFLGNPITIKFVIESDDSEEKKMFADYFGKLLEESGFKVLKILENKEKAEKLVYETNPAQLSWNVYTEALREDTASPFRDKIIISDMSSISGNQPGWNETNWWNYKNAEADNMALKLASGKIQTDLEYWDTLLKMNQIGLKEAVRIYTVNRMENIVSKSDRFYERLFYDLDLGVKKNALENAYTKNGILNVLQLNQNKQQFLSSWNPINSNGFSDKNTKDLIQMIFDDEMGETPFGQVAERRTSVMSTKVDSIFQKSPNGETIGVSGNILVPEDALIFDRNLNLYKKVSKGLKAAIETNYKINFGMWHHGREIKPTDYIYAEASSYEFGSKTPYFEAEMQSKLALKWNKDNTITIWSNKFLPKGGIDNIGNIPSLKINSNIRGNISLPWEIMEGIKALVKEKSLLDTTYIEKIDMKNPEFIAELKKKLIELSQTGYVPTILNRKVSSVEAKKNYNLAIKFIEKYGHPLIGNGPYILTKLDTKTGYAELSAFRNSKYTEEKGKWADSFRDARLRIDKIELPKQTITGKKLDIYVEMSQIDYPLDNARKTRSGGVELILVNPNEEFRFYSVNEGDGKFVINIDEETAKAFHGTYTAIYNASLDGKYTVTKIEKINFTEE